MHNVFKYLTHLLSATNQHGVHSPFVYKYLTKCLYSKKQLSKQKSVNIFLKSLDYFNSKTLSLPTGADALRKRTVQEFSELQLGIPPFDMLYKNALKLNNNGEVNIEDATIHNDTVVFVDNVHQNSMSKSAWKVLQHHEKVTVSIDLFYCGLVFFRKEQAKQHFRIRI